MEWGALPFLRLLIPFTLGIYLVLRFSFILPAGEIISALFFGLALAIAVIQHKTKKHSFHKYFGGSLIIAFLFAGNWVGRKNLPGNETGYFNAVPGYLALIRFTEPAVEKEKTFKSTAEVIARGVDGNLTASAGKIIVYMEKGGFVPEYGDDLLVRFDPSEIPAPSNPGQFDYKRHMQFRGVTHSIFLKPGSYRLMDRDNGSVVFSWCLSLRDFLLSQLEKNGLTGNQLAVGSALILGAEDDVDSDLMRSYSAAGVLHVLSVSGLHVAIIYWILNFIFSFLNGTAKKRWIKCAILILLIWFYAALTGLSPSVMRSATMFSFIILGQGFRKHYNIINVLACSAFFLLWMDPLLLMNVGFQLSYLAVAGIVILQPMVSNWWEPGNRIMNWTWSVISVSLAAQIATLPLSLYYFHNFPTWFLAANLIVIPLSSGILYGGVILFVLCWIPYLNRGLGWLLDFMLWLLNEIVAFTEKLPFSTFQFSLITETQTWILYMMIFFITLFFCFRRIIYLNLFIGGIICYCSVAIFLQYSRLNKSELVILDTSVPVISFSAGKSHCLYSSGSVQVRDMKNVISPFCYSEQLPEGPVIIGECIEFNGKKILFAGLPRKITGVIDILIFSRKTKFSRKNFPDNKIKLVLADKTVKGKFLLRLKEFALEKNAGFYSVAESGAFKMNLQ